MSSDTVEQSTTQDDQNSTTEAPAVAAPAREYTETEISFLNVLRGKLDLANEQAEIASSVSNTQKRVHEIRDDEPTEDKVILSFRDKVARLDAQRENLVKQTEAYIRDNILRNNSEVDVEGAKTKYKEYKDQVMGGLTLLGFTFADLPADFPALKTLRGGNVSDGATGTPKPRVSLITFKDKSGNTVEAVREVEGKDGKTVRTSNFTTAAQMISKAYGVKVETSDLQAETFEVAGTTDLKSRPDTTLEFSFRAGDHNIPVTVHTPPAK